MCDRSDRKCLGRRFPLIGSEIIPVSWRFGCGANGSIRLCRAGIVQEIDAEFRTQSSCMCVDVFSCFSNSVLLLFYDAGYHISGNCGNNLDCATLYSLTDRNFLE